MDNLLQEIHQIFKKVISDKINITIFMRFVFGSLYEIDSYSSQTVDYAIDQRNLYRYYNQELRINESAISVLESILHWPFDSLIDEFSAHPQKASEELHKELFSLACSLHISKTESPCPLNQLFSLLIKEHIHSYNVKKVPVISYDNFTPRFKQRSHQSCKNFYASPVENKIVKALKACRILILYSLPGMGKTESVKAIQRQYETHGFTESFLIRYDSSLQQTLNKIEYAVPTDITTNQKYNFLSAKPKDSLLIITHMEPSHDVLHKNFDDLSKLNLTVLITVDAVSLPEKINAVRLKKLSNKTLKSIFESSYNQSISDEEAAKLFNVFEYNTLTIKLLGKALANTNKSITDFFKEFDSNFLKTCKLAPIKYLDNTASVLRHISRIINYTSFIDTEDEIKLQQISVFNGLSINRNLLCFWFPNISDSWITNMLKKGILISDDPEESKIRLHRIFCELLYDKLNFNNVLSQKTTRNTSNKPSFHSLLTKISETIKSCWKFPYSSVQLQELSFAFFNTIGKQNLRFKTNKNQEHYSLEGNTWLSYCFTCIHFYEDYGNTEYANLILDSLLDSYNGIAFPPILTFEKQLAQIYTEWQSNSLNQPGILTQFDDMVDYISTPAFPEDDLKSILETALHAVSLYLDKSIQCIKENGFHPELNSAISSGLLTFDRLSDAFYGNTPWKSPLSDCYHVWTHHIDADLIHTVEELIVSTDDFLIKMRLLCDIVFFDSMMYFQTYDETVLVGLDRHYRAMFQLFTTLNDLPFYIIESYNYATIYHALCFTPEPELVINALKKFPVTYAKVTKNPALLTALNERVLSVTDTLNNFPTF